MEKNESLKKARFSAENNVNILRIRGSPYEMGYQHGANFALR